MLEQWLYASTRNGIYRTASFPIAFNTVYRCFITVVGAAADSNPYNPVWNDKETTATTVQVNMHDADNASPVVLAIGK